MTWETYVPNRLVEENVFLRMEREQTPLPEYSAVREMLPQPFWEGHQDALDCYWKAWELAFAHLRQPARESGFVANFIDTAFNDCLFMWDSAFILLFARYGCRAFDFQRTLDNFYAKQHPDGFICREIREADGTDMFERFDPASTGPNVLPWTEWEYFLNFGDHERLAKVFPCLLAYHKWFRTYRSWPDGTYWSCGWGCGMDNQPRVVGEVHAANFSHNHMAWIDATLQQIFSGKLLVQMAGVLGRCSDTTDVEEEISHLAQVVNEQMWDAESSFYYDRHRDGSMGEVKTVGAFWALPAEVVPPERLPQFIESLRNPGEFNRPHRVPSLSADHPEYQPQGDYWRGGVWTPTNYMILRGLQQIGDSELAHEIALNHHSNVVQIFLTTDTLWENYAPEIISPGDPARPDFVGWSGLPPIAVLFEFIFGIKSDVPNRRIVWDLRLTEEHGVMHYPFGSDGLVELRCKQRNSTVEEPKIEVASNVPLQITVQWEGGTKNLHYGVC